MRRYLIGLLSLCVFATAAHANAGAGACASADPGLFVPGKDQCLVMRKFGPESADVMVVWLHGDVSSGGPANYHFALARQFADENSAKGVLSVALVRPGYDDGEGNTSSVAFMNSGRRDHYTKKNIAEVAGAIEHLKGKHQPGRVLLVGHSGGAATASLMLGMFPGLADGAVLVACPCDLVAWRAGRSPWSASENPMDWVSRVAPQAVVHAMTGERDSNTRPELAQRYVEALNAAGVKASFEIVGGEGHNSAFRSGATSAAVLRLVEGSGQP